MADFKNKMSWTPLDYFFFYLLVQKDFNSKVHISTIFIEAILEIK